MSLLLAAVELATQATTSEAPRPTPTWALPVAGLVGALAGALIAGGFRLRGDRVARRADSQRSALYELQEGALALRKAFRAYGEAAPRPSKQKQAALDDADGRFELLLHRILCDQVREAALQWRTLSEPYWTGDDQITLSQEDGAWRTLQKHVGVELRRLDS